MTPEQQLVELKRGVVDCYVEQELLERLRRKGKLVVKAGFDPTRPDLHLGHTVLMSKMKQFQDLGHDVVFVVGDFTAAIGDPSGRQAARPVPTREEIEEGARTYAEQAFKVLDRNRTRIVYNSHWLGTMGSEGFIKLAGKYTLARMMEREDFKLRWANNQSISIHELLYPLVQAYDSVVLQCDVELGGADQIFNLLVGREIMREFGLPPQNVLTIPLLLGTNASVQNGKLVGDKMSKSLGNYVGVDEAPGVQFGKLMSISDETMWHYYDLLSPLDSQALAALKEDCRTGKVHPKDAKVSFAHEIVARFHGAAAAAAARDEFEAQFARRETPTDLPVHDVTTETESIWLPKALTLAGLVPSSTEGRRRIEQGGVQVDGEKVTDVNAQLSVGGSYTVKAGKRAWAVIRVKHPATA